MRKLGVLVSAMVLAAAVMSPAAAVQDSAAVYDPPERSGPVSSDNVTYHGTIPLDSPGVGGDVVTHKNGKRYFYATGLKGLTIYDISNPALPILASVTPFPHSQNEDLKVSDDGTRAVISADGSLLVPVAPATTGIHVFDTSNPALPATLVASSNPKVLGTGTGNPVAGEHTAECAEATCTIIYGSSGRIYDASKREITEIGRWNVVNGQTIGGRHALNRDDSGLVVSDSQPRLVLDPRQDPRAPLVLTSGSRSTQDGKLQHNNVRTDPAEWAPRADDDPVLTQTVTPNPRSVSVTNERPVMRAGELLIGNAESNLNPTCNNAGGLSTWSMANFDKGAPMQQLEVFRPLNGTWSDGSPAVNGLGCSGHWFTESKGIVAASWYEHGVRFFKIDKTVGLIEEVGYFQPVATEAGAAYWVDDKYVYSVDYARGIDILSFNRGAEEPSQTELDASWLANLGMVGAFANAERLACRLGTS